MPAPGGALRRPASSGLASIGLVLVVVLGVWLLNGRNPGTSTGVLPEPTVSASYAGGSEPTSPPTDEPSATATATATAPTTRIDDFSGLPLIALEDLPQQARDVIDLIFTGGPFAYGEDGSTFNNYEGRLPDEPNGYYAEYTVDTPGSDDRGARRIIAGDGGDFYWTDDHYASFARVRT